MDGKINRGGSLTGGALIISGTCIGAGVLALPLVTGLIGLIPATFVTLICWFLMYSTGVLFLEAVLWMNDGANVLSIAERFLGKWGRLLAGGTFLFLYYCLLIAYLSGGTPPFHFFLSNLLKIPIEQHHSSILFCTICISLVAFGTKVVDRSNWILMCALIISYLLMLGVGTKEIEIERFFHQNWGLSIATFPILFGSFGYHNVLPTIATYLDRDLNRLKKALLIGTLIPTLSYLLWQWFVIGALPLEKIASASEQGVPITFILKGETHSTLFYKTSLFFSFFALITSLLGVSLSMVDFFADGMKLEKRVGKRRLFLSLLVFLPPFLLSFGNPGFFKKAFSLAGGVGESLLNGLFPIAVVWIGRYKLGLDSKLKLWGGKLLLVVLALFTVGIMLYELMELVGK